MNFSSCQVHIFEFVKNDFYSQIQCAILILSIFKCLKLYVEIIHTKKDVFYQHVCFYASGNAWNTIFPCMNIELSMYSAGVFVHSIMVVKLPFLCRRNNIGCFENAFFFLINSVSENS